MARPYPALVNLMVLGFLISPAQSIMDFDDDLQDFCKTEIDIGNCAKTHLDTSLSLYDIFDIMTYNVTRLEKMCENNSPGFSSCIGPCRLHFLASGFSYLKNVCSFIRWIGWERECWTEQWALEARQCYRLHYPGVGRGNSPEPGVYPLPYRVYDRATIARDCFPSASTGLADKCSYYQTWIFQKLLPHYFELHGFPEGFEHIPDSIGFPGV